MKYKFKSLQPSAAVLILVVALIGMTIHVAFAGGATGYGSGSGQVIPSQVNRKSFAPILPTGSLSNVSKDGRFFDPGYLADEGVQHLGVDIGARAGSTVVSPVYGKVLVSKTSPTDAWGSYVVIEDFNTGWQHVIGHIDSDLKVGETVQRGAPIGTVITAGSGPHAHWGVNRDVLGAMSSGWGWGRAPGSATKEQAISKGWIDPLDMI